LKRRRRDERLGANTIPSNRLQPSHDIGVVDGCIATGPLPGAGGHPTMKPKFSKTSTLPSGRSAKSRMALLAGVLALLAIPHLAHAQGIVGGAREGSREGNRIAGPVGGVVGGAIGAGVGGAVGAVKGVIGIPDRGYRAGYECRGYYDRYRRFHCYR
jgi:hypothetical protein